MKTLQDLSDEVDALVAAGRWTRAEQERVVEEARAVDPDPDAIEFAYMFDPQE